MKWIVLAVVTFSFTLVGCANNTFLVNKEPLDAAKDCAKSERSYGPDGHIYTTLSMTKAAGYDDIRQLTLSYYSQYPDTNNDYEAVCVSVKYLLVPCKWEWRNDITGVLHSLHGGNRKAIDLRRKNIRNALSSTLKDPKNDWLSGLVIHAYGDSYAHTRNKFNSETESAYNVWIGHIFPNLLGNSPDNIKGRGNEVKYIGYVTDLYETLKQGSDNGYDDQEFKDFISFIDKLECTGGQCLNFHALYHGEPVKNSRINRFSNCMKENARPLLKAEVQQAIDIIKGSTE